MTQRLQRGLASADLLEVPVCEGVYVLVVGPGDRPPARAPHDVEPPGSAPEHGGRALAPAVPGRGQGAPLAPHPAQVPHLELSNCDIHRCESA